MLQIDHVQLGDGQMYSDKNPLDFMESMSFDLKTDVFEPRMSDYGLADKCNTEHAFDS